MRNDFAVVIITHGRADNMFTLEALKKAGYTGPIHFIVDDEDEDLPKYQAKFQNVHVFNKDEAYDKFNIDMMINTKDKRTPIYARMEAMEYAKSIGVRYILMLDDDIKTFNWFPEKGKRRYMSHFDGLMDVMIDWMIASKALSVGFTSGGDMIGGRDGNNYKHRVLRRLACAFFVDTENPPVFSGAVNEDVVTYIKAGMQGQLCMSPCDVYIIMPNTQSVSGGMTEKYLEDGTYIKAYYPMMMNPSCVKISSFFDAQSKKKNYRINQVVTGACAYVKIINEKWKKKGGEDV